MLLALTGASGAGKSTVLAALRSNDWHEPVECVELDSLGVPADADTSWRHGAIEYWVRHAVARQEAGRHLLLCGQVPMGELFAVPSAELLDGIAVCVLHCSPDVRRERLVGRGEPADGLIHHLRFGEWFHRHSLDPTFAPEVIRVASAQPMRWDRWDTWEKGDPRWAAEVIDTDRLSPGAVADRVGVWANDVLARHQTSSSATDV